MGNVVEWEKLTHNGKPVTRVRNLVNYLLSVTSKYYVPYQSDGRIGLSAA